MNVILMIHAAYLLAHMASSKLNCYLKENELSQQQLKDVNEIP